MTCAALGMTRAALGLTIGIAFQLGAQDRFEFKELHMGMEVRIVMHSRDEALARSAARRAFDRIEALENIMSDYRPESELRRLERRAGEWVPVSAPLFAILMLALDVAKKTDGAFDPTAAPVVQLWREARSTSRLPDQRALDSARALVGWRRIAIDPRSERVRLAPGTRLDLGGIAKGYIVQAAAREIIVDIPTLVEAGGDISVSGVPRGQAGWTIDVGDSSVVLASGSISMSGPQTQFVEIGGVRHSHVVDPRTGMALTSGNFAVVRYGNGAIADALATALGVMGPEGLAVVRRHFPNATARVGRR